MTETSMPAVTETIDVDVDPATAFTVFTDEFGDWWGNGPIDAWDSSRVVEHRIEPGVGGRVLEVYDDDALELARLTVWEPPVRLCWLSSVDEVEIEVTFEKLPTGGTRVRVVGTATSPEAGAGLAIVRMAPQWLPRHLQRRQAGLVRPHLGRMNLVLRSRSPAATARWLTGAFGFVPAVDLPAEEPTDPDQTWIELRTADGTAAIILWGLAPAPRAADPEPGGVDGSAPLPWIYVDHLDQHLATAERAGAEIVSPIVAHGFRSYTAADCEGRHWLFAQAPPAARAADPAS